MSNVIGFLEAMGQDARLRDASQGDVALALALAQVGPEMRAALLSANPLLIETLLGTKGKLCCSLEPAKDDEDEEPAKKEEEITGMFSVRGIAAAA